MAKIRRHFNTSLVIFLVIGGAFALVVSVRGVATAEEAAASTAQPAETQEEMDPVGYCKVRELREKLWLTNENLAAVGCNQAHLYALIDPDVRALPVGLLEEMASAGALQRRRPICIIQTRAVRFKGLEWRRTVRPYLPVALA